MDNEKYQFVCRVCLVKDSSSDMRPLANEVIREVLFECTSVWVEPGDKYPQQMCNACWKKCQSWSNFKGLAQESDRQLRVDEMTDDADTAMVKEEPLEGYSLEPEQEEGKPESDDPLGCNSDQEETTEGNEGPSGVADHKCGSCGKSFRFLSRLKEHEVVHTSERSFACDECDKKYKTKWDLAKHKVTHTEVKPVECDQCDKTYKSKWELLKHKLTHADVTVVVTSPFGCDQCDKTFKRKDHLKGHKLIHTGIKSFACDQCERKFVTKGDLKKHNIIHSGVKAFECDQCDEKYFRKCSLIKHKRTHSDSNLFKCDLCGNSFRTKFNLTRHLNSQHQ